MLSATPCVVYLTCLLQSAGAPYMQAEPTAKAICRYYKTDWRNIDKHLIAAVMFHESRFRQSARSKVEAVGLMQLYCKKKYKNWWVCNQCDVRKRNCNVRQGIKLLSALKNKYTSLYFHKKPDFWWVQYYNFHSKGYAKKVLRIRADLIMLGKIKCSR